MTTNAEHQAAWRKRRSEKREEFRNALELHGGLNVETYEGLVASGPGGELWLYVDGEFRKVAPSEFRKDRESITEV